MSKKPRKIFSENPYDIETVFESLHLAGNKGKELLYMDRLLTSLRLDSEADLTNTNYTILKDLELLNLEPIE